MMIGVASIAAFQLAASLSVRTGPTSVVRLPTIATDNGPMVSAAALQRVLPLRVTRDSADWYTLAVWGGRIHVGAGVASVLADGDDVRELSLAPTVKNGALLLPVEVVSDVFPSALPNMRWDADSSRLVLLSSVTAVRTATVKPSTSASVVRTADGDVPAFRPATGGALPDVPVKKPNRHLIIVDAGHGGVDKGMSGPFGRGPRIYEKEITLAVARRLGAALKARGVDVVYTRTADTLISLDDRGRIANKTQGDLFISVHVNAAPSDGKDPASWRGFETYFLSEARTEDARRVEAIENDATRFEAVPSNIEKGDPLSFILSDMQQNEHLRESSDLAATIQAGLGRMHPGPDRGVKQAGFRVLVTAFMPAVLVEIGFGTNPTEARYLSSVDKQNEIAIAIANAAMDYLAAHDSRVKGATASAVRKGGGGWQ